MPDFKIPWPGRGVDYTLDDERAVIEAMKADPQTQGKHLRQFEDAFSEYHGGLHSFAVSSGAAALEIAAMLCDFKAGDEVIIPTHTYCATALPFARRGVAIKWADIHPTIRTVTAETIMPLVTEKTKAIVVVHLYGCEAPISCIAKVARDRNILLIEDCAQSLGATHEFLANWNGASWIPFGKSGTHGDIACYSFHGQKNLTTLGEGGMIATGHERFAKWIPGLRHNGHRQTGDLKVVDFDIPDIYPFNYSIGEAQCAVGTSQLKRLDYMNAKRRNHAKRIIKELEDYKKELVFQTIPRGSTHVYHLLCASHPERDRLKNILAEKYGVECVIQYKPLHLYPLFKSYGKADCPEAEDFHAHALSFPLAEWFTEDMVDYLIHSIKSAIREI